jgi:hypothetical protein
VTETLVSITHLSKSYRRGEQVVPVLRDISSDPAATSSR